jgi:CheY-like chemotaxis protein
VRPLILVADDDPMLREFLEEFLTGEGYIVRCALDGIDALAQALTDSPDLLLTDILMPRLDGVSVLVQLRERGVVIPCILMSAHTREMPPQVTFLPKPFDLHRLLRALATAFATMVVPAQPPIEDVSISQSIP